MGKVTCKSKHSNFDFVVALANSHPHRLSRVESLGGKQFAHMRANNLIFRAQTGKRVRGLPMSLNLSQLRYQIKSPVANNSPHCGGGF